MIQFEEHIFHMGWFNHQHVWFSFPSNKRVNKMQHGVPDLTIFDSLDGTFWMELQTPNLIQNVKFSSLQMSESNCKFQMSTSFTLKSAKTVPKKNDYYILLYIYIYCM